MTTDTLATKSLPRSQRRIPQAGQWLPLVTVTGLSLILLLIQVVLQRSHGQAFVFSSPKELLRWAALLALTVSFALALYRVTPVFGRLGEADQSIPQAVLACWIVITGCALLSWPLGFTFGGADFQLPCTVFTVASFAWLFGNLLSKRISVTRQRQLVLGLAAFGLLIFLAMLVRKIWILRNHMDSPDFYYYVCYARDCFDSDPVTRFVYMPGVYRFWQAIMVVFGQSLAGLQLGYVVLLLVNVVLAGLVATRLLRSPLAGLFAACLYGGLLPSFEAHGIAAELFTTTVWLTTVLLWNGSTLRGLRGVCLALLLGAGIGLTLWTKQQGGLLALGALGFAMNLLRAPRAQRHSLPILFLVPASAVLALLAAISFEGRGLEPLRYGLQAVGSYNTRYGSVPYVNALDRFGMNSIVASWLLGWLALGAMTLLFFVPKDAQEQRADNAFWFLGASALAGIVALCWCPFPHYGMLSLPNLVLAGTIAGGLILKQARSRELLTPSALGVVGVILAVPLSLTIPEAVRVSSDLPIIWHKQPAAAADLERIRPLLGSVDDLLVVPPTVNEVHFALGTRALTYPLGYAFYNPDMHEVLMETLRSPKLRFVVIFQETPPWLLPLSQELQSIREALPQCGFRPRYVGQELTLWEKYE